LFAKQSQRFDEIPGLIDREADSDPLILAPGSNQFLGHQANHHDGVSTLGPHGNRVISGTLPLTSGPPVGQPDAVNPLGRYFGESVTSD